LPIHEEEDKVMSRRIALLHSNPPQRNNPIPNINNQRYSTNTTNRKFFPHSDPTTLSKDMLLKKFRSTEDYSLSQKIVPIEPDTISTTIQPASSTVSLDITKGKDITFTNYHVTCETANKKSGTTNNKSSEIDDKCRSTTITDF
jgi:hypothetical protein